MNPELSVIIPTFNNLPVLRRCVESWRDYACDQPVELLVIEDGCRDGTPDYLREVCRAEWGSRHVRWFHDDYVYVLLF
jgi:glycosyltransferase involved in cell wall biosynthesis